MDNTTLLVIGIIVVLGLLVWKFDAIKFTLEGLGLKTSAEGSRTPNTTEPQDARRSGGALASGRGSVAVGEGAADTEITTDVTHADRAPAPVGGTAGGTSASGAGSVAIGGGAKGAKIATTVRDADKGS